MFFSTNTNYSPKVPSILDYSVLVYNKAYIINSKEKAILIPRDYLLNDSFVVKPNGDKVAVKTGLKDYQKIEIISGIAQVKNGAIN